MAPQLKALTDQGCPHHPLFFSQPPDWNLKKVQQYFIANIFIWEANPTQICKTAKVYLFKVCLDIWLGFISAKRRKISKDSKKVLFGTAALKNK